MQDNSTKSTAAAGPALSEVLGPLLPEPYYGRARRDGGQDRFGPWFDAYQMRAYAAQQVAAERERWTKLRDWVENSRREQEAGLMMSIAESIHGEATLRDVLNQMAKMDLA